MPSYVVTGASRGLGYAWVTHLASIPGNVVIGIVRNKTATDARLAQDGVKNVHIFAADITDHKALETAAAATAKITGGSLDILIHNAALVSSRSSFKTLLNDTPEGLEADLVDSLRANVIGTAHAVNAFLPLIRAGEVKKIVVSGTGMADTDFINDFDVGISGPYSVSKGAVAVLVAKYNAVLGKKEGILVFALSPGIVDTSEGQAPPDDEEALRAMQELGAAAAAHAPSFKGPISTQESIEHQLQVIERATIPEFGGQHVSHFGNKQWV